MSEPGKARALDHTRKQHQPSSGAGERKLDMEGGRLREHCPLSTHSQQWVGGRQHLEREAGWLLQAAGLTVEASKEGGPCCRLRGEVKVVVQKLAPLHEHERPLLVPGQLLRGEAHDGVGDLTSLRDTQALGGAAPGWASRLAHQALTRGTEKPLRLTPGVQPKGSEKPSSYSAGSQRAKARLEAPSVGLRLQKSAGSLKQSGSAGLTQPSRSPRPGAAPVVALPGDGAICVPLRASHPHVLVGTAT